MTTERPIPNFRPKLVIWLFVAIPMVIIMTFAFRWIEGGKDRWDAYFECISPPPNADPDLVQFCQEFLERWKNEQRELELRSFTDTVNKVR